MSRSLNRIRSLVSEIEQIQKQGQRAPRENSPEGAPVLSLSEPLSPAPHTGHVQDREPEAHSPESLGPSPQHAQPLHEARSGVDAPKAAPAEPGRVSVQWSGTVILELHLANSSETVEMRQVGDQIEIRFSDGKAFHIPFKSVA